MEERYYATGRRKTAVARVWITQGTGQIKVNNREVMEYFGEAVRQQALMPLTNLGVEGDFDIWCTVKGGGITGQAGALRHGLARALVVANEEFRKPLRKHGFLTRDSRMVERKKYGQPGRQLGLSGHITHPVGDAGFGGTCCNHLVVFIPTR